MKYVIAGAVIIVAVFLIVLSTIPIGIEPLTELYFNDHTNLPSEIEPAQTYEFSFTINNLEYKNMTYNYVVNAKYGDKRMYIDNNNVFLEHNDSVIVPQKFQIPENFTRAEILVTIKDTQTIHFWVNQKD